MLDFPNMAYESLLTGQKWTDTGDCGVVSGVRDAFIWTPKTAGDAWLTLKEVRDETAGVAIEGGSSRAYS
jgi:hypothetical protein